MIRVYDRKHALKMIDRLDKYIKRNNSYDEPVVCEFSLSQVQEILGSLKFLANVVEPVKCKHGASYDECPLGEPDCGEYKPKTKTQWMYFYCGMPHPSAHYQYFPSKCPPHMMREFEYMGKTELVKEEIDE